MFPGREGMRRAALWAAVLVPLVTAEAWVGMTPGSVKGQPENSESFEVPG